MANEKKNMREELNNGRFDWGLMEKVPCTSLENQAYKRLKEEGKLPEGVFEYQYEDGGFLGEFYIVREAELTPEETMEYLTYKKLKLLKTIKNCVMFFTVLTIISLVAGVIIMLAAMS